MQAFDQPIDRNNAAVSRSSHAGHAHASDRREFPRPVTKIHPALAFLAAYGVPPSTLLRANAQALASGDRPERILLASGAVTEDGYYAALARHLGLSQVDDDAALGPLTRFPQSIHAGAAPLVLPDGAPGWVLAPEGARLDDLLTLHRRGALPRDRFFIASPSRLSNLVFGTCGEAIAHAASHDLQDSHGPKSSALSVTAGVSARVAALAALAVIAAVLSGALALALVQFVLATILCSAIVVKLFAVAESCETSGALLRKVLSDAELPVYSVIVALYREAGIAGDLISALDALDYPAARLDILLVVEADDHETRMALEALDLPARYRIVIAPDGQPRTKPRALNVALAMARGEHVCIFDAEDAPEPGQLREAAERFAALPQRVACLQGRLVIDNAGDGWLARCFAIEYAALFEVYNPGLAALRLPVPFGGTSNHFRTAVLRDAGGWDAWNVTEDIDLGLRLARCGYETGALDATTLEEAPDGLGRWMRQRRRWFKGWMQTLLVYAATPRATIAGMGPLRAWSAMAIVAGTLAGAMLGPLCAVLAIHDAAYGHLLSPRNWFELIASTAWCFVAVAGTASAFWPAFLGLERRGMPGLAGWICTLPAYWLLQTVAAWWALVDLLRNPFDWLKTDHGLARTRRRGVPPLSPASDAS